MIGRRHPEIAPRHPRPAAWLAPLVLMLAAPAARAQVVAETPGETHDAHPELPQGSRLMYTTYFYTAAEAVVNGYEDGTEARIVSMESGEPVWAGTIMAGDTELVSTGRGVFAFYTNKKAEIFVGTPSSCTVIGYFLRDEDGAQRSQHFLTQLPPSGGGAQDRLVVWAAADTHLVIQDLETEQAVRDVDLRAGDRLAILPPELTGLLGHRLDFRATGPDVLVQLYQDEGFTVPAISGRGTGREFVTYVGGITEGVNDLDLVSYYQPAHVRVEDLDTEAVVWDGQVPPGGIQALTLSDEYLRVTADTDIAVFVAPYAHYGEGYAEHHYSMGAHGTGIETDFLLPSPGELWIFSYFDDNPVQVQDAVSGETLWSGTLRAGQAQGLHSGHGFFHVRSELGVSVMGGSMACGGEYSPAAGMYQVDEALLAAVVDLRRARVDAAAAQGVTLSPAEANAPPTEEELDDLTRRVRSATGNEGLTAPAVEQRLEDMIVQ